MKNWPGSGGPLRSGQIPVDGTWIGRLTHDFYFRFWTMATPSLPCTPISLTHPQILIYLRFCKERAATV